MFIPNEIITEILNIADHQTWINKIKEVNQQYHSNYYGNINQYSIYNLYCRRHRNYTANWRYLSFRQHKIYPICRYFCYHPIKHTDLSPVNLPHNY